MTLIKLALCALAFSAATCSQEVATSTNENKSTQTNGISQGLVLKDVPAAPNANAKYLFYLHGRLIENEGIRPTDPRYGVYEYEDILKTLAAQGFTVISEARPRDTDINQYAEKVAGQIHALLNAKVPPRRITILGASKGAIIAMRVSTVLRNKNVNFIIMSNCNDWVDRNYQIDLHGNVLSIYDVNDEFARTCRKFFDKATGLGNRREVMLKVGTGHAVLYKPMKEWVDLVVDWANQPH